MSDQDSHIIDEPIEFTIKSQELVGERIDKHLAKQLPTLSRRYLQDLMKNGKITVNDNKIAPRYRLKKNDVIKADLPNRPVKLILEPEDLNLNIIYEDSNILLINKRAGMVVHPADRYRHLTGTVVNAVLHHCNENLSGINGVMRPGIIHRLDKNTSGLLIVGKSDFGHKCMAKLIKNRAIEKTYLTLVKGRLKPEKGSIDAPIGRDVKFRYKHAIGGLNPKDALTHYEVLEYFGENNYAVTLLKVRIITGRTHQIRIHFASIGHPVVGDDLYGDASINAFFLKHYQLERQFLHAWTLKFRVPGKAREDRFFAELPSDLQKVLDMNNIKIDQKSFIAINV